MASNYTVPVWPFNRITKMTPHPRGQWVKRINYKLHYFGAWAVPDPGNINANAALAKYLDLMQRMQNGTANTQGLPTTPAVPAGQLTLNDTVNSYMAEKNA